MKHELWLGLWWFIGMATYMLKRAYYLVTGPNPIAVNYTQFIERCWIPLLVRMIIEGVTFWMLFTPGLADKALAYLGWNSYAWVVELITQYAPVAFLFGHTEDSIVDFLVSKLPIVNNILPQMPGALPKN